MRAAHATVAAASLASSHSPATTGSKSLSPATGRITVSTSASRNTISEISSSSGAAAGGGSTRCLVERQRSPVQRDSRSATFTVNASAT